MTLADTLVRALFHFLWEGAVIALLLAAAIHLVRPSSPRVRYTLACLSMLAMLAAFGITVATLWPQSPAPAPTIPFTFHNPAADLPPTPGIVASAPHPDFPLQWIALLWIAGVSLFVLRTLASWISAIRMRRVGVCASSPEWQRRVAALAQRIHLSRPVQLLESALTDTPAVVGFLRPVILVPAGLLAGLPAEHLELILLHELAHIRRYDYFVNLLQTLAEDLLFYHPAVWWVSSLIRAERENCCDDEVVAATGNARAFAAVLAELEQTRSIAREAALAANGGHLMNRIRRLIEGREPLRPAAAPAFAAGLLLAATALAVYAQQNPPAPPAPPAPPSAPAPPAPPAPPTPPAAPAPPSATRPLNPLAPLPPAAAVTPSPDRLLAPPPPPSALVAPAPPAPPRPPIQLAQARPPAPPAPLAPPAPPGAALETPYTKWLNEDVIYLISDQERTAFNRLQTDEEREMFIEQFWLRRDPTPDTKLNELKEEHYRRIAYSMENFNATNIPGWKTDRGMIYIKYGPPDEREQHPNGGSYQRPIEEGGGTTTVYPFEKWRYKYIQGMGTNVNIEFVDPKRNGEYHMTTDPAEKDALLNVPGAGLTYYEALGLAQKADRFSRTDGTHLGTGSMPLPASMDQFTRLEQFANLQSGGPPLTADQLRERARQRMEQYLREHLEPAH
ncbi:MAG TPA: GWxTD domain-containing protein [Bryobacteraceae bacterium]|jgi:GWxTD domain-containing protein